MITYLSIAFWTILGLCLGSFLNVCIHRIPQRQSIVHPGSTCPGCGRKIRFYDNIPIASFLLLCGRCRQCGASISPRYPLVEALTGAFSLAVYLRYGWSPEAPIYLAFICALITVTFIDLDHRIIPDVISLPGILLGFAAAGPLPAVTLADAALGILLGGGSLYTVAAVYRILRNAEGMGGGDIKLLAMIGAVIGWKGVLFTLFAASFFGSAAGLLVILRAGGDMRYALPFGPFLSAGAILHLFWGPHLIDWYLTLLM